MTNLRLVLSFKESERWIYEEIQKHSGKGNWIKDVLAEKIKEEQKKKEINGI